ncbi:hypothetical protein AcW1_005257 [Taiwanofungus camphoratus]|nr:hypothetical protein AcW2_004027 [Antrodia cinnamomea]KAI0933433.1 hypothetical protein AcV5_005580 [Antrodia cinnamomea]KAI0948772.1 hypothetical protein AcV7_009426 [Antrodia cinnamomea]KAI0956623.1 hypothetical protein AcW1_005257 [Antrodia cinnamomea]
MPLKKSVSPELIGQPSPYHPAVTIYDPTDPTDSPRRSKRLKILSIKPEPSSTRSINVLDDFSGITDSNSNRKSTANRIQDTNLGLFPSPERSQSSTGTSSDVFKHPKPRKGRGLESPRKRKPIPQSLETPHPPPPRWREVYDKIKEMRSRTVAPVDTMGCGRAQLGEKIPKNQRFATLISLMLSSQTKDEVTSAAVDKLREAVGGSLSVDAILGADEDTVSQAICKVGFWRRKTQYIKKTAQRLYDDFDSDIPKTVDELCSLPGVGPKMAFLALHVGWKLNAGIGVDVHVHRITNRLGWHDPPTKTPEETRLNLQSWIPTELRPTLTGMFVGFGQTICLPIGPRCDTCELSGGLCPSARKDVRGSSKKTVISQTSHSGPKVEIALDSEEKQRETTLTETIPWEKSVVDALMMKI